MTAMHEQPEAEIRVFDAHVHVGEWGIQEFDSRSIKPLGGRNLVTSDDCRQHMRDFGVSRMVVVPIYTPDKAFAFKQGNPLVVKMVEEVDQLLGGLWVSPDPEFTDEMELALEIGKQSRLPVLKMNPNTWHGDISPDPRTWLGDSGRNMRRIMNYAAVNGKILQFHTQFGKSAPGMFCNTLSEYGNTVTFQFVHMGLNVSSHFRFVPLFADWLEAGLDVYCDTSLSCGFALPWLLSTLKERGLTADRVLFASDHPWGFLPAEIAGVRDLEEIPMETRRAILFDNAFRLYGG